MVCNQHFGGTRTCVVNMVSTTDDLIAPSWYTLIIEFTNKKILMVHGRRPIETQPDHGINTGTNVTKKIFFYIDWLIRKNNMGRWKVSSFFFCFFPHLFLGELSGLEI